MTRSLRDNENQKRARARRDHALARQELGQPTVPRIAAGVTSMGIKVRDPADDRLIREFLERRHVDVGE